MRRPGAALGTPRDTSVPKHAALALVVAAISTLALPHVPVARWLVWPLVLVSTVAHEMGHGIAAVLVGGDWLSIEIRPDASGVTLSAGAGGRIQTAIGAAGGLLGPAFTSMALFWAARRERGSRIALALIVLGLVVAEIMVVRNLFGLFFVGALALTLGAVVRWGNAMVARFALVFLAVNLAVSVFTRGDYLFTRTAGPGLESDVQAMSNALLLPYWFWGAVCGAISIGALIAGLYLYLRRPSSPVDAPVAR